MRQSTLRVRASTFVLCALLGASRAHAERPASLSWTRRAGAEACIDARALATAVETRIGHAVLVAPSLAEVSIEGQVERRGRGWRATVIATRPDGAPVTRRTLDTAEVDCRALDPALTLVIALIVDPAGAPPPPDPAPKVVIREIVREVIPPWQLALAGTAALEVGALPRATVVGEAAIRAVPPGLPELVLSGFAAPHQERAVDTRRVRFGLAGLGLAICPERGRGPWRFAACGGARLAWIAWKGQGFDRDAEGRDAIPALTLDARVERRLAGPLALYVVAGVRAPLRRLRVTYAQSASVMGPPEVVVDEAARASLWTGLGFTVSIL